MTVNQRIIFAVFALVLLTSHAEAASKLSPEAASKQKLKTCLKEASDLPDMAEAHAMQWYKQGGGDDARLCHATAQFNRNEFELAAKELLALAASLDARDPRHATELHTRSGLAFTRARDAKSAEIQYGLALQAEPNDPEIWVDRALERASFEKFWDAISDVNHALSIMPDMVEALRLRGQCWMKLDNKTNAQSDFNAVEQIEETDKAKVKK